MKYFLVFSFALLTSCAMFTAPNPEPAIILTEHINEEFKDVQDALREVIENSTGLTLEQKQEILDQIDVSVADRKESIELLQKYLASFADLDSSEVLAILVKYKTLQDNL